ncbi:MAG: hypothetical protein KC425_07320 [Anaerolineales bacterium]|nr:hypothetical protein [Anaerolineales bacterium]
MSGWTYFSSADQDVNAVITAVFNKLNSLSPQQAATARWALSDLESREAQGVLFWREDGQQPAGITRQGSAWNQRVFFTNQGYETDLYAPALALLNGQDEYCPLSQAEALNCHVTMTNQRDGDATLTVWWPANETLAPVDLSRRYDRTTFAMAHDSHTAVPLSHTQTSSQVVKARTALPVDQSRYVSEQLADGIRACRISADLIDGEIRLHHNQKLYQTLAQLSPLLNHVPIVPVAFLAPITLALNVISLIKGDQSVHVQTVFSTLEAYLQEIKTFLDAHPHEVVTLFDEGSVFGDEAQARQTVAIYDKVFGLDMMYVHEAGAPWPTLGEMVERNQRVVLFSSSVSDKVLQAVPQARFANNMWNSNKNGDKPITPSGNVWENDYENHDPDTKPVSSRCVPDQTGGVQAPNRLYLYNHFFYTPAVQFWPFELRKAMQIGKQKIEMSDPTKSHWTVGELLRQDVEMAALEVGHPPNFINVDFYQGVNGTRSTLIPLVNKMNAQWGAPIAAPTGSLVVDLSLLQQQVLQTQDPALRQRCLDFIEASVRPDVRQTLEDTSNLLDTLATRIGLLGKSQIPQNAKLDLLSSLPDELATVRQGWQQRVQAQRQAFAQFKAQQDVAFFEKWLAAYVWSAGSVQYRGTDLWQGMAQVMAEGKTAVTHNTTAAQTPQLATAVQRLQVTCTAALETIG